MSLTTPAPVSPYSPNYYSYRPRAFSAVNPHAQYLAEQRERARALRYQHNEPTPNTLLAQEYDECPGVLSDDKELPPYGYMASKHVETQSAHFRARVEAEIQLTRIREREYSVAFQAHIEEEQYFARWHADAEKFLAEVDTYLSTFLPLDQEPCLSAFRPFDLPDTPALSPQVPASTSEVFVQDDPSLEDVIKSHCMAENPEMFQLIFGCLCEATSTEVPIEHAPVPPAATETSSSAQNNVNEGGITSSQEGKGKAKEIPDSDAEEPSASPA
ncbi:hypothetical protein EDB19DRAFT_1656944 [Suillus lakei]|nr:hypothetical protein EDB19DRAFT_1656944 [Suillus lakei]